MRIQASQIGLALALASLHAVNAATCKTLSDPSSTFIKSVATQLGADASDVPAAEIFSDIDKDFAWLSKCVAAVDPMAVYTSLGTSSTLKTCISTIENSTLEELGSNYGWSIACPIVNNTIIPCINAAMTEVVMDTLSSTGTCCDDFLSEIKTMVGDSLSDMVTNLVKLGANAACSKRTFTNLKKAVTTEMCGYSIYNSFTFIDTENEADSLINLAQIPNNQMCKAFSGETFTNTKSGTATVGFGTSDVDSMGICLQPVDKLLQYIASWPIWKETLNADGTSISLSSLFTSDKSLRGNLLISYAKTVTNMPMIFLRATGKALTAMGMLDNTETPGETSESPSGSLSYAMVVDGFLDFLDSINSYATTLLLHVPNNGGCTFADQTIVEVYTIDAEQSAASKLSLLGAIGGALLSSVVLGIFL